MKTALAIAFILMACHLYGVPSIALEPPLLTPTNGVDETAPPAVMMVRNAGDGSMDWTATGTVGWLSCIPSGGTLVGAGARATVTVNYATAALGTGSYAGGIEVASPDAPNSPQTAAVALVVMPYSIVLREDFEASSSLPAGWTQTYLLKTNNWIIANGGYDDGGGSQPPAAHGGTNNALFYLDDYDATTVLATTSIDFGTRLLNTKLAFWHSMRTWGADVDRLLVCYRTSAAGAWNLLAVYTNEVYDWTEHVLDLPQPGSEYYIGFFGVGEYGYGVCIDDIEVRANPGIDLPFLDITNPPANVANGVAAYAVAGTNNSHVVGSMWVTNMNMSVTATNFGAAPSWTAPAISITPGTNWIVVYGTNQANNRASDSNLVVRSAGGLGIPFISITSPVYGTVLPNDIVACQVAGTNNEHVIGKMWVTNSTVGGPALSFPAAMDWTAPSIGLATGLNTLMVFGTNLLDTVTGDTVVVERNIQGSGKPFVDITNAPMTVPNDQFTFAVAGTNNQQVMGDMWVTNVTAGGAMEVFAAATNWIAPPLDLAEGGNLLVVSGTNLYGTETNDSVIITRGPVGTGTPFVDITNTNATVPNDATAFIVAGTNNSQAVGRMMVTNLANGIRRTFNATSNWSATPIPLVVGSNTFMAVVTNAWNVTDSDTLVIIRDVPGTGAPFVDITNSDSSVGYDVLTFAVAGTNNAQVLGGMIVTNESAGGIARYVAAAQSWTSASLGLIEGVNRIVAYGTNLYGTQASNAVVITRGPIGTGRPFLDITNTPVTVPNDVVTYAVAGTNNLHVAGFMWVTNPAVGGAAIGFAATSSWTTPALSLATGTNRITVVGTNAWGIFTNDTVVIVRDRVGTGMPFVDITNAPVTVPNDVAAYAVGGTNNAQVVGGMWVTNLSADVQALSFPATSAWTAPAVGLVDGPNIVMVAGTNLFGMPTNDTVIVIRGVPGTGTPFVDLTNAAATVSNDVTACVVGGTNNAQVVGGMWVTNAALGGASTRFLSAASWTAPPVGLVTGPNVIIVFGTNAWGVATNDAVVITRMAPPPALPFVDLTNDAATVGSFTTNYVVAGTNNSLVIGDMWVTNETAGGPALAFPATPAWTAPAIGIEPGPNRISVYCTNAFNALTNDAVVITRLAVLVVDVTNELPARLSYYITSFTLGGTNNRSVAGMWWTNLDALSSGSFSPIGDSWECTVTGLQEGTNRIRVSGTSVWNDIASDDIKLGRGLEADRPLLAPFTNCVLREHQVLARQVVGRSNVAAVICTVAGVRGTTFFDTTSRKFSCVPEYGSSGDLYTVQFVGVNAFGMETQDLVIAVTAPAKGLSVKTPLKFEDADGDLLDLKYSGIKKANSVVLFDGQNIAITNAYAKGAFALAIKKNKLTGDGTFSFRSFTADNDSKSVTLAGTVGEVNAAPFRVENLKFSGVAEVSNIWLGSAKSIAASKGCIVGTVAVSNGFETLSAGTIAGARILAGVPAGADLTNTPALAGFKTLKATMADDVMIAGRDMANGTKVMVPAIKVTYAFDSVFFHTLTNDKVMIQPIIGK